MALSLQAVLLRQRSRCWAVIRLVGRAISLTSGSRSDGASGVPKTGMQSNPKVLRYGNALLDLAASSPNSQKCYLLQQLRAR